jgi:hypothetical protein
VAQLVVLIVGVRSSFLKSTLSVGLVSILCILVRWLLTVQTPQRLRRATARAPIANIALTREFALMPEAEWRTLRQQRWAAAGYKTHKYTRVDSRDEAQALWSPSTDTGNRSAAEMTDNKWSKYSPSSVVAFAVAGVTGITVLRTNDFAAQ